jgi:hypothetical protein
VSGLVKFPTKLCLASVFSHRAFADFPPTYLLIKFSTQLYLASETSYRAFPTFPPSHTLVGCLVKFPTELCLASETSYRAFPTFPPSHTLVGVWSNFLPSFAWHRYFPTQFSRLPTDIPTLTHSYSLSSAARCGTYGSFGQCSFTIHP